MEYINLTTVAFAASGAYYMYANVVKPRIQAQRTLLADQARKELLRTEEECLKRGPNRQSKKKYVVCGRQRNIKNLNEDDKYGGVLNRQVAVANSFEILDNDSGTAIGVTTRAPVKNRKSNGGSVVLRTAPPAQAPMREQETPEKEQDRVAQAKKSVKFDLMPRIQADVSPSSKKKERKAAARGRSDSSTAVDTASIGSVKHETPSMELAQKPETPSVAKKQSEPRRVQQQGSRDDDESEYKVFQKAPKRVSKPMVAVEKMIEEIVEETVPLDKAISAQEIELLQASLQLKDLALTTANSRVEKALRVIESLQNQIKNDTELVKSAKKADSRAQKAEAKLESLNYTNSLLVRQLLQEQDRLKTVQEQALKEAAAEHLKSQQTSARVQELETQLATLEQERAHLKIQTDSDPELNDEAQQQLDSKSESTAAESKDARIASLEADIRVLEGELENAKLQVEQHSEAMNQAEEQSRNRIKTLEDENLSLMEEVRQRSDKIAAKEEEIDRLVDELFVARVRQSKASNASDSLSSVDSVDTQDAGDANESLLSQECRRAEQLDMEHEVSSLQVSSQAVV